MKKIINIVIIIVVLITGYVIRTITYKPKCEIKKDLYITITNEFINVREYANAYTEKLGQVKENDKYLVKEKFTGNPVYDWYLIEYEDGKFGWVASEKEFPYVEEMEK